MALCIKKYVNLAYRIGFELKNALLLKPQALSRLGIYDFCRVPLACEQLPHLIRRGMEDLRNKTVSTPELKRLNNRRLHLRASISTSKVRSEFDPIHAALAR